MRAMILAAGLGTRLRPLTMNKPKPLIPVGNKPIIDTLIQYLKKHGIRDIIVNAHHHSRQIIEHLGEGRPFGINIEVKVEPKILGTGGGIKNAEDFLDSEPFIVINGDILTDIDLIKAYEQHRRDGNLATLILHDYKTFNQVQIDEHLNVTDILSETRPGTFAFTGIHIIEPELFQYLPQGEFSNIIDCYRKLIKSGEPIRAYLTHGHYWRDMGTINSYLNANKESIKDNLFLSGPGCRIHRTARVEEWAVIGENACLEEAVEIRRSVLWKKVTIKRGTKVIDSIVTSSKNVQHDLIGKIY